MHKLLTMAASAVNSRFAAFFLGIRGGSLLAGCGAAAAVVGLAGELDAGREALEEGAGWPSGCEVLAAAGATAAGAG